MHGTRINGVYEKTTWMAEYVKRQEKKDRQQWCLKEILRTKHSDVYRKLALIRYIGKKSFIDRVDRFFAS